MTIEDLENMGRSELLGLAEVQQIQDGRGTVDEQTVQTILQSTTAPPATETNPKTEATAWIEPRPEDPPHAEVTVGPGDDNELPFSYNQIRIVLMVRDPYWVYTYWDYSTDTYQGLTSLFGNWETVPLTLRVYEVTEAATKDGEDKHLFDIPIDGSTRSWYIHVNGPDRAYRVDLGYFHPCEGFVILARSNVVKTPRDSVSPIIDGDWMVIEEDFRKLYRLAGWGRPGSNSAELVESLIKRLEREIGSGAVSSISSPSFGARQKERGFWLVVNCELIVFGATEPDARLTIDGQPIALRPDGSFTLRMALPDGKFRIPVEATSAAGDETITITPVVERQTYHHRTREEG